MLLYIVRHGEPVYDPDRLTELGRRQAEALSHRLAVHGLDRIFTSPNGRARETAEPTCRALGISPETEPWMSEDLTWSEFSNNGEEWSFMAADCREMKSDSMTSPGARWFDSPAFAHSSAPESGWQRIAAESDRFTERLGYVRSGSVYRIDRPSEERIAAFCHQGFGLTWLAYLLGIHPCLFWSSFDMTHSGVTVLHFENFASGYTAPRCLCLSDTSHIFASGLPLKYHGELDF